MAVEYTEIIEDNPKNYLDFYLQSRKRLPISLDVHLLLTDLRDRTHDPLNSQAVYDIATLMIEHLEKSELTEDDLPLKWFIDLIEDYKQGKITIRIALIRFLIKLEHYGDAIKNQAIFQKIDDAHRRRDYEALIEVQKEEMARKRGAVEYLALEEKKAQLEQIPVTKRGKDDDTLEKLDFAIPLVQQRVKYREIARRWLIKKGQLAEEESRKKFPKEFDEEAANFRQILSRHRKKKA